MGEQGVKGKEAMGQAKAWSGLVRRDIGGYPDPVPWTGRQGMSGAVSVSQGWVRLGLNDPSPLCGLSSTVMTMVMTMMVTMVMTMGATTLALHRHVDVASALCAVRGVPIAGQAHGGGALQQERGLNGAGQQSDD